jgi:hypothetical protein
LHLSAYIHKNPKEIKEWEDNYHKYPYSSYKDYLEESRWGDLLSTGMVLKQFKNLSEYKNFVTESLAKEPI